MSNQHISCKYYSRSHEEASKGEKQYTCILSVITVLALHPCDMLWATGILLHVAWLWRQHNHKLAAYTCFFPSAGITCTSPSQGEDRPHLELLYMNCIVSCPSLNNLALPLSALPCPALSCSAAVCPALACPALPCSVLPDLVFSCPALPRPASPRPTLP